MTFVGSMITPSSTSRLHSESCHLDTIYVTSCPQSSSEGTEGCAEGAQCASADQIHELQELAGEEARLERQLENDKIKFDDELNQLEDLIADHRQQLAASLERRVRIAGRKATRKIQQHRSVEMERQLARQDRVHHFRSVCRRANEAKELSASLQYRRQLLQSLWDRALVALPSSALQQNLKAEGSKLIEAAVKSCARKHAIKVAKAALILSRMRDEQLMSKFNGTMDSTGHLPCCSSAILLRGVAATPCLQPLADRFNETHQRGYGIELRASEKDVMFKTPRGNQVLHFPNAFFGDHESLGVSDAFFCESVIPILSGVVSTSRGATIFVHGCSNSGKDTLFLGGGKRASVTAALGAEIVPEKEKPPGVITRVRCAEVLKSSTEFSSAPTKEYTQNKSGIVERCLLWLLQLQNSQQSQPPLSSLSLSMYELYNDHICDLLDFSVEDSAEHDRHPSKPIRMLPRELTLLSPHHRDNVCLSGWDIDAKRVTVESVDAAMEQIRNAMSSHSQLRKSSKDWGSIFIDLRFVVSHRVYQATELTSSPSVLQETLRRNSVRCDAMTSPARLVLCKLPGAQRQGEERDKSAVCAAKKSLGALKDVLVTLKDSSASSTSMDNCALSIEKSKKIVFSGAEGNGRVSLSHSTPQLLDIHVSRLQMFDVPTARNGLLMTHQPAVLPRSQAPQESKPFIPYRSNKITQILSSALGADSKHLVIVSIAPCSILETTIPRLRVPVPDEELLREAYLRFGQQAPDMITSAKLALQFLRNLDY